MSRLIRGQRLDPKQLRQESYEEGFQRGLETGRNEMAALLARAQADRAKDAKALEQNAITLALEVATRIVGELAKSAKVASYVAKEAHQAAKSKNATILVHPDDLLEVQNELGPICTVSADNSITRGGCIVETDWGRLDAQLEIQLKLLKEALLSP